jgi:hypothetical protein
MTAGDGVIYIEYVFSGTFAAGNGACIGVAAEADVRAGVGHSSTAFRQVLLDSASFQVIDATDGTVSSTTPNAGSFTTGDTMGMEIDFDNDTIEWFKNGTSTGSVYAIEGTFAGRDWVFMVGDRTTVAVSQYALLNVDEDDWTGTPSAGAKPWKLSSKGEPTAQGIDGFNAVLYTGDGAVDNNITGAGFAPDWVWMKARSSAFEHSLFDITRGVDKRFLPAGTGVEGSPTDALRSFDADGFTVDNSATENNLSTTYVAFCQLGSSGTVSNTDGDVTSTITVAPSGHFSCGTWPGTASSPYAFGHGLDSPDLMIIRSKDSISSWYTTGTGPVTDAIDAAGGEYVILDASNARFSDGVSGGIFTADAFTAASNTFKIGTSPLFASGDVGYFMAFKVVPGVCSMGRYIGTGGTDGPYMNVGFKPRFIMLKRYSGGSGSWVMVDTARTPYNDGGVDEVYADLPNAEYGANNFDITATGFKIRTTSSAYNTLNSGYFYIALADVATGSGLPPIPGR